MLCYTILYGYCSDRVEGDAIRAEHKIMICITTIIMITTTTTTTIIIITIIITTTCYYAHYCYHYRFRLPRGRVGGDAIWAEAALRHVLAARGAWDINV